MTPITYVSENVADYNKELDSADTLDKLRSTMLAWAELARDAFLIVETMNERQFRQFRSGLALERKGKFAGETFQNQYAAIVMPMPMFEISMKAQQFHVPFGMAYIRWKEYQVEQRK